MTPEKSRRSQMAVRHLMIQWRAGEFDCRPQFQRGFVWSADKASALIESVLLGFPVPEIQVNNYSSNGRNFDQVVDGQQRCTSLFTFIEGIDPWDNDAPNPWRLRGIDAAFNGKAFKDLEDKQQSALLNFSVSMMIIESASLDQAVEIFRRLNQNATPLNNQELRHALYSGPLNGVLEALGKNADFMSAIRKTGDVRMASSEFALRFLAFYRNGATHFMENYQGRRGKLRTFLDDEMKYWRENYSTESGQAILDVLLRSIQLSRRVFGDTVFSKTLSDKGRISAVTFEVLTCGFALYRPEEVLKHKDRIRERFLEMCASDEAFRFGVDKATADAIRVMARFRQWGEALHEILGDEAVLPASILGNPTSMIPALEISLKPADGEDLPGPPVEVQSDLLSAAEETLPCGIKEMPSVESAIAAELLTWPAEERLCDTCNTSIQDHQLARIVCTLVEHKAQGNRYSVSHGAGDCASLERYRLSTYEGVPITGDVPGFLFTKVDNDAAI